MHLFKNHWDQDVQTDMVEPYSSLALLIESFRAWPWHWPWKLGHNLCKWLWNAFYSFRITRLLLLQMLWTIKHIRELCFITILHCTTTILAALCLSTTTIPATDAILIWLWSLINTHDTFSIISSIHVEHHWERTYCICPDFGPRVAWSAACAQNHFKSSVHWSDCIQQSSNFINWWFLS